MTKAAAAYALVLAGLALLGVALILVAIWSEAVQ
jgi:hypothetical protein